MISIKHAPTALAPVSNTGQQITINQLSISYNDFGSTGKPVLLFIHGFPLNKGMWSHQLESLSDDFRVIAYDIRGFGQSEGGDTDFSMNLFASDLIAFMDALHLEKVIVCGMSMGGYIALNAINRFPDRFEGLVLCDTQSISDTPEISMGRFKKIEKIQQQGLAQYASESIRQLFTAESFIFIAESVAAVNYMILNTAEQTIYKTLRALSSRYDMTNTLSQIAVPVLIMVGKEDSITPPESSWHMYQQLKDARVEIIPCAGHMANMENVEMFNEQLRQFALQFSRQSLAQS
ncbi:MAG: alpha/beta fold hydrolase [Bacteroidota bacterium]